MVVLDLFSGAGGLSEGFFREGAEFAAHVEADHHACDTLKTRVAYWNLKRHSNLTQYNEYLLETVKNPLLRKLKINEPREKLWEFGNVSKTNDVIHNTISEETFDTIVKKIRQNMRSKNLEKVDVIIGGPPCQAYSVVGRARMKEAVLNDHRNFLYEFYAKFLEIFKPKMFVFENVLGLKSAGNGKYYPNLKNRLEQAGYHIEENVLIASDYGVLQNRQRIIIVGWKIDKRRKHYYFPEFEKIALSDKTTVNDVLKDLPVIPPGASCNGLNQYVDKTNQYLVNSEIRPKDFNILTWHEARPHNERDREIYKEAIISWNERNERLCYAELAKQRPELITHKNTHSFTNRFNVIKSNLQASHTILAHMAMDGHYYIHPDIKQIRSLSVREAARLQSFPDDFYFEGPRTSVFRQIGNAVPPKMAQQIAKKIKSMLESNAR